MERLPVSAGIGLRRPHVRQIREQRPELCWLEVHPENYFWVGGPEPRWLDDIRRDYPLSFHGVGLSMGSADPLDDRHLTELKRLVERYAPALVSEHCSWSSIDGVHHSDLLPLPTTAACADHVRRRVDQVQDALGRQILLENVTTYVRHPGSAAHDAEFLAAIARATGCGILLDLNNLYVNACNHGYAPEDYMLALPVESIGEIHLAGHSLERYAGTQMRIDTHNAPVCEEVWQLYARTIEHCGAVPTLIEWDEDIPPLEVLQSQAHRAAGLLEARRARAA